ncbi:hypothetical protein [Bacillus cereus]|uniref:hypothetical protein n=1 Tax=Bacillus cereus TaxID=1396 RepID=UPI00384EBEAC
MKNFVAEDGKKLKLPIYFKNEKKDVIDIFLFFHFLGVAFLQHPILYKALILLFFLLCSSHSYI